MAIFKLSAAVTVSAYTEVEAGTLEEAIKIAGDRAVEIGGERFGYPPDEYWVIEDADGAPTDIHAANE